MSGCSVGRCWTSALLLFFKQHYSAENSSVSPSNGSCQCSDQGRKTEALYVEKQERYEAFPKPETQHRSINSPLRTASLLSGTDFSSLTVIHAHTKVIYLQATHYATQTTAL